MCDFLSGLVHVTDNRVAMAHPMSHSKTVDLLGLNIKDWREWEWTKSGLNVRVHNDGITAEVPGWIMLNPSTAGGQDVKENCIVTCEAYHQYIHEHPAWAEEHGFLASLVPDQIGDGQ